jgi:hypothetical protein
MTLSGLDLWIGRGADLEKVVASVSARFAIPSAAIVAHDAPDAADAVLQGRWAFIHAGDPAARFPHKLDVEFFQDMDWRKNLAALARDLGVEIACPDERSPGDFAMLVFAPDGCCSPATLSGEDLGVFG